MSYSPTFPFNPYCDASPRLPLADADHALAPSVASSPPKAPRFLNLIDLLADGMMTWDMTQFFLQALRERRRLIVTGAVDTGKTTLLRALAQTGIPPHERVAVVDAGDELHLTGPRVITQAGWEDTEEPDGLRQALGCRPDRLIVGELRGTRLLDYLEIGLTTSLGLLATLPLRQPEDFVDHIRAVLPRRQWALPEDMVAAQISQGVDLLIAMLRDKRGRRRVTRVVQPLPDGTVRTAFAD